MKARKILKRMRKTCGAHYANGVKLSSVPQPSDSVTQLRIS